MRNLPSNGPPQRQPSRTWPKLPLVTALCVGVLVTSCLMAVAAPAGWSRSWTPLFPVSGAVAAVLAYLAVRRLGSAPRWVGVSVCLAVAAAAWTVPSWTHTWARDRWPSAEDRYFRDWGGQGRCLYATPYGYDSTGVMLSVGDGELVVGNFTAAAPELHFTKAGKGERALVPDASTRELLRSRGCVR